VRAAWLARCEGSFAVLGREHGVSTGTLRRIYGNSVGLRRLYRDIINRQQPTSSAHRQGNGINYTLHHGDTPPDVQLTMHEITRAHLRNPNRDLRNSGF
jgi:hypothetical protein